MSGKVAATAVALIAVVCSPGCARNQFAYNVPAACSQPCATCYEAREYPCASVMMVPETKYTTSTTTDQFQQIQLDMRGIKTDMREVKAGIGDLQRRVETLESKP